MVQPQLRHPGAERQGCHIAENGYKYLEMADIS